MPQKLAPVHPGEVLAEDFMAPRGLSANQLALALRVPANRLTEVIRGRRSISADTALRLARYFDTTPGLWMNLQSRYDLDVAQDEAGKQIEREVAVAAGIGCTPANGGSGARTLRRWRFRRGPWDRYSCCRLRRWRRHWRRRPTKRGSSRARSSSPASRCRR